MTETITIEPAATIIFVRDSNDGPEVLMQQRNPNAVFVGGAWVFPGGKLDPEDSDPMWSALVSGLDEAQAQHHLSLGKAAGPQNHNQIRPTEVNPQHDCTALAYWVAALREAFEEAGILLTAQQLTPHKLEYWREQLLLKNLSWHQLIVDNALNLDVSGMSYLSRWVTPPDNPRRYDTRFFIGRAPQGQTASHEDYEAIQTRWIKPSEALAAYHRQEMELIFPTLMTLQSMSPGGNDFTDGDELIHNVLKYFNPDQVSY
ncbi:MAG: NUDIX hydrolase [Pseudomonadales bacterium]|nr:NUDIX hydrolase [Pseudomonadales bacterium]